MEIAAKITSGFKMNLEPLREPLGFIKVLEWVFAIFAFATCGGYSGQSVVNMTCPEVIPLETTQIVVSFSYPFRLNKIAYDAPGCINHTEPQKLYLQGDLSPSSEFFVTIGAFAFLCSLAALVLYLGYHSTYQASKKLPIADFLLTVLFAFLWLVSSSAWAQGLTDLKFATAPSNIISSINLCQKQLDACTPGQLPIMGRLNASVIFGFMNVILWVGNGWFAYKETIWHKPTEQQSPEEPGNITLP
ncbi:synaptophysin-like protein 1 isoform X1 [Callorhinchus milii]|uniref:Synaptophysin-like 2b n=2 Tax=Callorhinchus milii TaxID=7868 RepID=V9L8X1_CALMI|nr:synaptophysin-like protein 1 isoform X1 [Callorhinchus milii]XP_042198155.1 synaptophysin-like protein 1 isoform X1 [Callorhinchus milii]|eukprot:gi/632962946/ref/XP_007897609.1/ PREDICTED: synaptophysin-like protein 2 isoform X1 [Callorhinchus milii]